MPRIFVFLVMGAGLLASSACASTISASTGSSGAQAALPSSNAVPKPTATILRGPSLGQQPRGWLRAGKITGSLIYVAAGSQVAIFPESADAPPPIGAITDKVDGAYGLFVDANRDLFVANSSTVTGYRQNSLHPYIVYSDPGSPLYIVKDHAGRLYAANRNGTITEYAPRHTTPDRTLQTAGVEADGINLDDANNLYVAYRDHSGVGSIEKFPPDSKNGQILGMQLDEPQGLQLDHAGNILVVESGKEVVDVFLPGTTSPSKVVQAGFGVTQVVLRAAEENMYFSNFANDNIYISHYPPGEFQLKIQTGLNGVQGMALSNEER